MDDVDLVFYLPAMNPYWARRLSRLASDTSIRFECWILDEVGVGREWTVGDEDVAFPCVVVPGRNRLLQILWVIRRYLRVRPKRVLTFHFVPWLWPALLHRVLHGGELAFYAELTFDSWVSRSRIKEIAKHVLFRTASTIFVPGEDAMNYLREYCGDGPEFRILDHSVPVRELAAEAASRAPGGKLRFLYLGRLVPEKGIRVMISAFDSLPRWLCSADFSLEFVGGGVLQREIEDWALTSPWDVSIRSFVQADQLASLLRTFDVLVFPTLGDPYGLVVNECFAAGIPVIASDAAGEISARVLGPGGPRGVLFPCGEIDSLRDALTSFILDRDSVVRMSQRCSAYAEEFLKDERWVASIVQWISDSQ